MNIRELTMYATDWEQFQQQWQEFLESEYAKRDKGVVFKFRTEKPLPRANGESPIIYIGQTSKSVSERYLPSANLHIERTIFEEFYRHYIEKYGPISVEITKSDDPLRDECDEIANYKNTHWDLPPLNRESA